MSMARAGISERCGETAKDVIAGMVEQIVGEFQPLRIVLFGSQARGAADNHSDIDMLVVMGDGADSDQAAVEIGEHLQDLPMGKDIVVTTPDYIERTGDTCGHVVYYALREGITLYERRHSPEDEARRWLLYAEDNIAYLNAGRANTPRLRCWLSHQAASNALKAALVLEGAAVPFTHDLNTLLDSLPDGWPAKRTCGKISGWVRRGTAAKRSGSAPKPTSADAAHAVSVARDICDSINAEFRRRGVSHGQ